MLKRTTIVKPPIIVTRKLYIDKYNPQKITSKWSQLDPYFVSSEIIEEIVSTSGLFELDQKTQKLIKLKQIDKPVIKKPSFYKDFDILLDYSHNEKDGECSQIPYEHSLFTYHTFNYCLNENTNFKKALLYLVIEGVYSQEREIDDNKYKYFCPINIYFILKEDFDNILIKKELNEFLSLFI